MLHFNNLKRLTHYKFYPVEKLYLMKFVTCEDLQPSYGPTLDVFTNQKEIFQPVCPSPIHPSTIPRPRSSVICFSLMKYFLLLEICIYEIRHYVAFLTRFSGALKHFSSSVHVEACHSTFFLFTELFSFCLVTATCENSLHVFTISLFTCIWTFSILGTIGSTTINILV